MCKFCNQTDCTTGHWGKVKLSAPLARPAYIHIIVDLLKFCCIHCGLRVKISSEEDSVLLGVRNEGYYNVLSKLQADALQNVNGNCCLCGSPKFKIDFRDGAFVSANHVIPTEIVYRLLNIVPYHHYPIITKCIYPFADLFWYPWLPIPSLMVRDKLAFFNNQEFPSNITRLLIDIISKISAHDQHYLQKQLIELELSNEVAPNSSYAQSIKGKMAMFRQNINAMRREYTSRVVVNLNQSTKLDWFVAADEYYKMMYVRMTFNSYTRDMITRYAKKGQIKYVLSKGNMIYADGRNDVVINNNDSVEIIIDDVEQDIGTHINIPVLCYRFPVLHRGSLICFQLKKNMHCNTNTINSHICGGMNLDQDGDELNTYQPISIQSQYEVMELMRNSRQLINQATGNLSCGMILFENYHFTRWESIRLTNYQLSYILPPNIMKLCSLDKTYSDDEIYQLCLQSIGITLPLKFRTKSPKEIGTGGFINNIFKLIIDLYNPDKAVQFMEILSYIFKRMLDLIPPIAFTKEYMDNYDFFHSTYQWVQDTIANNLTKDIEPYIKTELTSRYKKFLRNLDPQSSLYNLYHKEVKLTVLTLLLTVGKSTVNQLIREHYLNRSMPIFNINTQDIRSTKAFVTQPFLAGYTLSDNFNTVPASWSQIITTTFGTAISGRISRELNRNMQECVIDTRRWFVMYNMIIDPMFNSWKMPNSQLYEQKWKVVCDSNDEYDNLIKSLYNPANYGKDIILFPVNVEEILQLYPQGKVLTQQDKIKLFQDLSRKIYLEYWLGFGAEENLLLALLVLLRGKVTDKAWFVIESMLIYKYDVYPDVGSPEGLQVALTIGETLTQSTLANFHISKKSGEEINTSSMDTVALIRIQNQSTNGVLQLYSTEVLPLLLIKQSVEYVNLGMLGIRMKGGPTNESKGYYTITLTFDEELLALYHINTFILDRILTTNLESCELISECTLRFKSNTEVLLSLKMGMHFVNSTETTSHIDTLVMIIPMFGKGVYCPNRFTLKIEQPRNELIMINDDHTIFKMFDTSSIQIALPPENNMLYFGKPGAVERLKQLYPKSNPTVSNVWRSLALFQGRYEGITRFAKLKRNNIPTIAKVAYENAMKDFQGAAMKGNMEYIHHSVDASIFCGSRPSIGTNYFKQYLDPGFFMVASEVEEVVGSVAML